MRKGTGIFGKGYSKSVQRYQGARHCRTQDIEAEKYKLKKENFLLLTPKDTLTKMEYMLRVVKKK